MLIDYWLPILISISPGLLNSILVYMIDSWREVCGSLFHEPLPVHLVEILY